MTKYLYVTSDGSIFVTAFSCGCRNHLMMKMKKALETWSLSMVWKHRKLWPPWLDQNWTQNYTLVLRTNSTSSTKKVPCSTSYFYPWPPKFTIVWLASTIWSAKITIEALQHDLCKKSSLSQFIFLSLKDLWSGFKSMVTCHDMFVLICAILDLC